MYCKNCGEALNDDQKFCTKCGQKVELNFSQGTHYSLEQNTPVVNNITQKQKYKITLPCLVSGLEAFIFGCIGAILTGTIAVDGFLRPIDRVYNLLVELVYMSNYAFIALILCGLAFIVLTILSKFIKKMPMVEKSAYKLLLIIPLCVFTIISIIAFIPYFCFINY